MSERRFDFYERDSSGKSIYACTITEAQLKCRCEIVTSILAGHAPWRGGWDEAREILLHGYSEKEQPPGLFHGPGLPKKETDKEYCVCGKPAGHREDCWLDGKPDEWEEWANITSHTITHSLGDNLGALAFLAIKKALLSIPCNPRRKP